MKKITFLFAVLFSMNFYSNSPNYSLSPGAVMEDTASFNTLSIYDIYQVNTSANSIQLKWNIVSISIPNGWDYSICQLGTCFPGIPNGGTMDSVVAGDMGFLGLNINPYFINGTAIVKAFVYENGYFSQGDTLTWIIHAITTSMNDFSNTNFIKLYPNPAADLIKIKSSQNFFRWSIIDNTGRIIKTGFSDKFNDAITIDDLMSGNYFFIAFAAFELPTRISFIKL
ncbi:MAG: T9SS type A sorting domain-containing protein [Bacteroidota bacterium]|jgi:hypothetical protein